MAFNHVTRLFRSKDLAKFVCQNINKQFARTSQISVLGQARYYYIADSRDLQSFYKPKNINFKFHSTKAAEKNTDQEYRDDNKVTVIGEDIPSPYTDIGASDFPDYIKSFLRDQNFTTPTIIQAQSWPIALNGRNFVGIAQTGTGKTLAYLLPAVVHIKENEARRGKGPRVLVLAPTRELARQIEQVANDFKRLFDIRCVCIYGGASRGRQLEQLNNGADIVIATPGRLNDFISSKCLFLSRCTYVVLDEADRMLDMGFEPQIREALEGVPLERQILMFSATWPKEVRQLAMEYLGKYVQVNVGSTELSANHNIHQHVHVVEDHEKMDKFKNIMHELSEEGYKKVLVFTNTKSFVDTLAMTLRRNGWQAVGIHGDKSQVQRDTIIKKFKSGWTNILVATDVAARGLDVDGISHVINYDFPNTTEDYIHRIGRTGRSDNKGVAHTLLTSENSRIAKSLIAVLKEANQEIPEELLNLARSFTNSKGSDKPKYKQRLVSWNTNKQWSNDFRKNNYRNRY